MIVVLGGGPAGRIASIRLASAGKEVRLIERGGLGGIGGQCLHFGCMPVCAMNDVARQIHEANVFRNLGIFDAGPHLDFAAMLREMRVIQGKIAAVLDSETRNAGVEMIYGKTGRVEGKTVFLNDEKIPADTIIVATGSRPNIPEIEGVDRKGVFSPHTIFGIGKLPEHMVIIGGGIMAAEFASIFSAFGTDVTVLSRSIFLKSFDRHLRALALKDLADVKIHENTTVHGIEGDPNVSAVLTITSGMTETLDCDTVLVAAGLIPRSEMLIGLKKGPSGEIIVNDHMQTSVPGVYACGDVVGPPYLTPVARHQGIIAADTILGNPRAMDYRFIPQSMNLSQELGFCITEHEGTASLAIPGPAGPGSFWSVPSGRTGLAKIFFEPESGEVRGMCASGPGGGLITGYMAFLMRHHFSVRDFEDFIEVHPSTDGVYWLAKYAAEHLAKRKNSP
jgi:dihydrolipoamide dehydrogenase